MLLPHFPNLILLRWLGGKVRDSVLGFEPSCSSSSSDFKSESWADPRLSPELRSDGTISFFSQVFYLIFVFDIGFYFAAMSKRISLMKLAKKVEKNKVATSSTKGMVIREKKPRDEAPDSSPNKKGKIDGS